MARVPKHGAHAIVRVDLRDGLPYVRDGWPPYSIMVTKVLWDGDEAIREVDRLNRVNADKQCRYFATYTRVVGGSPPVQRKASRKSGGDEEE